MVDEKTDLLTLISNLSALIAGFAVVAVIEFNLPTGTPQVIADAKRPPAGLMVP